MSFRFVDHTAELQLELEAPTREAAFAEAVAAVAQLFAERTPTETEPADARPAESRREVSAHAADDAALLAAWLEELLFAVETEGLVPQGATQLQVGEGVVQGLVDFAAGSPLHLVKGVTYHDLALGRAGDGSWRGRVVLDV